MKNGKTPMPKSAESAKCPDAVLKISELAKQIAGSKSARAYRAAFELYGRDNIPDALGRTKISELHAKITGSIKTGLKITESSRQGGQERAEQIRKERGGACLKDRKSELRKRLAEYTKQGHSVKQACKFLSKQNDVTWTAEYLRKNLLK